MTLPLRRLLTGSAVAAVLLLPLPAQAVAPVSDPVPAAGVTSVAPEPATTSPAVAERRAYSRTARKDRVDSLMHGSLARFHQAKNRTKSGMDATFNWDDDGCSAPWWTGTQAYSIIFKKACQRHDFGYRNLGWGYYTSKQLALSSTPGTKDAVDRVFLADMRKACEGRGSQTGPCQAVAQGYYGGVRKTGKAHTSFYQRECQPGYLCLFDDDGYGDRRVRLSASEDNLKDVSFGDKTSSLKNTSGVAWRIYDDAGYSDRNVCVPRNGYSTNLDELSFGDKASSAKRYSTASCP